MSLHVERFGHGPSVVLLHGWAMHGGVFAPLVERLRERCTVHVVDLPGHGLSRDADVPLALDPCVDAITGIVPDDALWCGWSLGGLVALQAAQRKVPMRGLAMLWRAYTIRRASIHRSFRQAHKELHAQNFSHRVVQHALFHFSGLY